MKELKRPILAAVALAVATACATMAGLEAAYGQGLFRQIIDAIVGEPAAPVQQAPAVPAPAAAPVPAPAAAPPANPAVAAARDVAKNEDAFTLLVVGDFLASSLANALADTYVAEPRIVVVNRTSGSSGLVRDDYYDWVAELPAIIAEVEPDYIAIMIGTNDRQGIAAARGALAVRSPEWDVAYGARVQAIAEILGMTGRPVFWIGMPPMRPTAMSSDMAFFNRLYGAAIESVGGSFIDVWDAFADADGRFTATGPDIAGQQRTLRADDGFSFTGAGREKLAYYLDREIRLPGIGDAASSFLASDDPGDRIEILADGSRQVVGPIIALGEPPPGAATELLGDEPALRPQEGTDAYLLLVRGQALPPVPGRVDDFSWPK
ncbi:MAG: DUF459 domain-containing protein [Bauldia sp.]|nr:DUF459 domain-containing protein [Bauldia sp.]